MDNNIIDTVEVHKAVEDGDRLDTSAGNTSFTYEVLENGELRCIGEQGGKPFNQTLPMHTRPCLIAISKSTNNLTYIDNLAQDWNDDLLVVRFLAE